MSEFFAHPGWQRLLLALLHATWVIALIGAAWWVVLRTLQNARTRYAVELAGLALFALAPLVTFVLIDVPVADPAPVVADVSDARSVGPATHGVLASVVADETTPAAESTWIDWLRPWLLLGWLSGVGVFTVRLTLGLFGVAAMMRGHEPLPERLVNRVRRLRRTLEIPASVVVAGSRRVVEAVAVGFFRPAVLIPTAWLASMPTAVLEAIVAHELAHVRRWDLWVNLLQRVLEALLFFHPVVWWLSGRVRVDRELCCDDLAARATGKRVLYARALEYVAIRRVEAATPLVAAGWGGTRMRLLERVKNVLGMQGAAGRTGWWPLAVVAIALGTGAWFAGPSISAAVADDEERSERREGDRERDGDREREERREGDRERGEREERREGDREREERRDGDRERGERDGDRERGEREGDREGERRFDGDREREGERPRFRDGDRPRFEGERDGDRPRFREVDRPFGEGERRFREGDRPPGRDGDRPRFDGERDRPPFREGDRPRPPFGDRPRPEGEVGELIDIIRDLRREVQELRREVNEIRERRPEFDRERERPRFGEDELRERLRRELEEVERRERDEIEEIERREREFDERRRDFERERERFDDEREEREERRRFDRERDEDEGERPRREREDDDEDEEEERRERDDDDGEERDDEREDRDEGEDD